MTDPSNPVKRAFLTLLPAKRVYLCPHNLLLDRAGLCPECEAKRRCVGVEGDEK